MNKPAYRYPHCLLILSKNYSCTCQPYTLPPTPIKPSLSLSPSLTLSHVTSRLPSARLRALNGPYARPVAQTLISAGISHMLMHNMPRMYRELSAQPARVSDPTSFDRPRIYVYVYTCTPLSEKPGRGQLQRVGASTCVFLTLPTRCSLMRGLEDQYYMLADHMLRWNLRKFWTPISRGKARVLFEWLCGGGLFLWWRSQVVDWER